jgi:hypothetical protein
MGVQQTRRRGRSSRIAVVHRGTAVPTARGPTSPRVYYAMRVYHATAPYHTATQYYAMACFYATIYPPRAYLAAGMTVRELPLGHEYITRAVAHTGGSIPGPGQSTGARYTRSSLIYPSPAEYARELNLEPRVYYAAYGGAPGTSVQRIYLATSIFSLDSAYLAINISTTSTSSHNHV